MTRREAMPEPRLATQSRRSARRAKAVRGPARRVLAARWLVAIILGWSSSATEVAPSAGLAAVASAAEKTDDKQPAEPKTASVTFDTIKLDMKKGDPFKRELLTEAVKKIDGKPIRIRGYILPSFQQSGIKQFVLVRDNMECCFGPGAALFDCIMVEMSGDATTDYTVRPVSVEGQFSIKEVLGPDQKHLAIYHLDAKSVK